MLKKIKNLKGFVLIEVMMVIIILGIISFFSLPSILNSINNNKKSTDVANAKLIYNATTQVLASRFDWEIPWEIPEDFTLKLTLDELRKDELHEIELNDAELINNNSNNTFKKALLKELNDELPLPHYKGNDVGKVDFFVLKIDKEGNIAVLTGSDRTDFSPVEVAPVADIAFQPK